MACGLTKLNQCHKQKEEKKENWIFCNSIFSLNCDLKSKIFCKNNMLLYWRLLSSQCDIVLGSDCKTVLKEAYLYLERISQKSVSISEFSVSNILARLESFFQRNSLSQCVSLPLRSSDVHNPFISGSSLATGSYWNSMPFEKIWLLLALESL